MLDGLTRVPLRLTALLLTVWGAVSLAAADLPSLKVGHVGHDHHTALYVAAENPLLLRRDIGVYLRAVEPRKRYELMDGDRAIAAVDVVLVGGGALMPTALAQGVIDVGLGGTAAVLAAIDKNAPIRLIAPLHSRGDMFVLNVGFPADTWTGFVAVARERDTPIRIGFKDPAAVAKILFEAALRHAGLTVSSDPGVTDVDVVMINVKGGGQLNSAAASGLVDGYAGNNPFPAIGKAKGIVKTIASLDELPPRLFRDHPCCCVAASTAALRTQPSAIINVLAILQYGTSLMNAQPELAVAAATQWLGTTAEVERESLPTSLFTMAADGVWRGRMAVWLETMGRLDLFSGRLAGKSEAEVADLAYDLRPLAAAQAKVQLRLPPQAGD